MEAEPIAAPAERPGAARGRDRLVRPWTPGRTSGARSQAGPRRSHVTQSLGGSSPVWEALRALTIAAEVSPGGGSLYLPGPPEGPATQR